MKGTDKSKLWKALDNTNKELQLIDEILKDAPGRKFRYNKVDEKDVLLPSHILRRANKVLDYCKARFKIPGLKIEWVEPTKRYDPDTLEFDFPIAGKAESSREILVNAWLPFKEVALTVAHEAFHAYGLKAGKDVGESQAERAAQSILDDLEKLEDDEIKSLGL